MLLQLVCLLIFASVPSSFIKSASANSVLGQKVNSEREELAPGVIYKSENFKKDNLQQSVRIIEADISRGDTSLQLAIPSPINRLTRTSQLAIDNTREGHFVVGGINASFNETNGSTFPANLVVKDNIILNYGRNSPDVNGPNYYNYAFGIAADGKAQIAGFQPSMSVSVNGTSLPIHSINLMRENGKVALFTPSHRTSTVGANPSVFATEIVVTNASKDTSKLAFGDTVTGTVSAIKRISEETNATIPSDGFVISAVGAALGEQLKGVEVGQQVTVTVNIDNHWRNAQYMIATGPNLVNEGKVSISMNESSNFASGRNPRTAIGISKDRQKVFMVTIDGRQSGYSNGVTLRELAQLMISLGADRAINLDGGGSTTMVARLPYFTTPVLVNRPSDGRERSVSNSLQVVSTHPPLRITEPALLIDNLETIDNWKSEADRARASIARVVAPAPVRMGNAAVKLDYDYTAGESGVAAAYLSTKFPVQLKGDPSELGLWAFGDGKSHWLRAQIIDGDGQRHRVDFTAENKFDWVGWKHVRATIPANLKRPISLERIYIAQPSVDRQGRGTVYFDHIEAIYNKDYKVNRFKDVSPSHWAATPILELNDRNVITGYFDGSFKPELNITREQVAIMLARQLKLNTKSTSTIQFRDVDKNRSSYPFIAAVAEKGLITGKDGGIFDPQASLTRAEMASILVRAYNISGTSNRSFSDVPASHWAYNSVQALVASELTTGYSDGTFRPNRAITRAEFSAFLYRMK